MPSNPLLQHPASAAGVGFFWGWAAGNFKNWLGDRLFERFQASERKRDSRL